MCHLKSGEQDTLLEEHSVLYGDSEVKEPECHIQFRDRFQSGKYKVSSLGSDLLNTLQSDICIRKFKGESGTPQVKFQEIKITASSNSVNNTGESADFCKKGFPGLSLARARTIAQVLIDGLQLSCTGPTAPGKSNQGEYSCNDGLKITLSAVGRNGDGTSGACAYKRDSNSSGNTFKEIRDNDVSDNELNNALEFKASFYPGRSSSQNGLTRPFVNFARRGWRIDLYCVEAPKPTTCHSTVTP
jgi:hypothetical protein